jgi:hypothetical protein
MSDSKLYRWTVHLSNGADASGDRFLEVEAAYFGAYQDDGLLYFKDTSGGIVRAVRLCNVIDVQRNDELAATEDDEPYGDLVAASSRDQIREARERRSAAVSGSTRSTTSAMSSSSRMRRGRLRRAYHASNLSPPRYVQMTRLKRIATQADSNARPTRSNASAMTFIVFLPP